MLHVTLPAEHISVKNLSVWPWELQLHTLRSKKKHISLVHTPCLYGDSFAYQFVPSSIVFVKYVSGLTFFIGKAEEHEHNVLTKV